MRKLSSVSVIKEILAENSFRFSKSLGQNFLIDENVLDAIISGAGIDENSCVLEVGPGFGTLTQKLCMNARKVVSVEIDETVIPILKDNLKEFDNLTVVNNDILKTDIAALLSEQFGKEKVSVCANLPYYITTPVITALLKPELPICDITVMVQKEVAERLAAKPGKKDYGAISLMVGYYAEPELLVTVPPSAFIPQPKVSSAVIRLKKREKPPVEVKSEEIYFKVIKSAFAQRRKTLLNSVANSNSLGLSKPEAEEIFEKVGIDSRRRGETLSMEEFAKIANAVYELRKE